MHLYKSHLIHRVAVLVTRVRAFSGADLWAAKRVMEHCYLGDWFVLYQLSKNSNSHFFRYLLRHMDRSLNCQVSWSTARWMVSAPGEFQLYIQVD